MRYFRFEIERFEVLRDTEPALVVAYHGGPWTVDLWMLGARMYEELGYFPRAVWHRVWWRFPLLRQTVTELGGLPGPPTDEQIETLKSRGEHLVVAPGGTREATRPFWRRHTVDFGERRGYLRLAERQELPIIPVVAIGVDETFVGLNDGYELSRRILGNEGIPLWLGIGLGGVWPLALPLPVKICQRIGDPIRLDSLPLEANDDEARLEQAHHHITTTLQSMLDTLRRDRS